MRRKKKKKRKRKRKRKGARNDICKQENMQAQTSRKASTMAHRFLETPNPFSQKGKNPHSPPIHKNCLSPLRFRCSPLTQSSLSSSHPQHSCSPSRHPSKMTIIITSVVRKWLMDHGLQGFIQVAKTPPHPNAFEMASKLNIDTLTNSMVCKNWA